MSEILSKRRSAQTRKTVVMARMSNTEEILAKQTTLIKERNNSLISDYSNYSNEKERWALGPLKKQFKAKDVSKMFVKYQARLQHTFFMVLLLLNIFFSVIAIVVYFFDEVCLHLILGLIY